ncbi:unnamed protein product [Cuscuta campestris]|uniref:WEB family protein n=1 Tax=Cuscuta campestris TaxID=132261 RepID=A0A484LX62_9ASTE|nr:unnamed protein product [Cuscuta campestris]
MAEREESTETMMMKRNTNPRAVIDTSPPFESVREAVDRFGGSGPWVPHHLLRLPPLISQDDPAALMNLDKMEEDAVRFERDLMVKEREALGVLKEVEAAKRYVEGLKLNLTMEEAASSSSASPMSNSGFSSPSSGRLPGLPDRSPGTVLMELNQAKEDLDKMSSDLSVIRSSVESLNKKVTDGRQQLGKSKCMDIVGDDDDGGGDDEWDLSFESEQFKKMAEASSYEVMKAALEIERTKESMRMAEMRLVAAKKMEEAAKAVEAIAIAQRKALLRKKHFSMASPTKGTTVPYVKPHKTLTPKAQQVEDHCKTKFVDSNVEVVKALQKQGQDNNNNNNNSKHKEEVLASERRPNGVVAEFKDPIVKEPKTPNQKPVTVFGSTMSIGDVLNKRASPTDDVAQRQHVSFSQMLRGQSGAVLGPAKSPKGGSAQRKKFGFIQVPLAKQNKKRGQAMNSLV